MMAMPGKFREAVTPLADPGPTSGAVGVPEEEGGLFRVTDPGIFAPLFIAAAGSVDKGKRFVVVEKEMPGNGGVSAEAVLVEMPGGERHDLLVHPVLFFEEGDGFGVEGDRALQQGNGEAAGGGRARFDRRGKLAGVAGEDQAFCL